MPAAATLVYQTTEDNGTGNLGLTAVNGYQSFADAFPSGTTSDSFDYFISNRSSPEWERGTGHWSGASLVRDTVLESSNSNSPVAFTTGIKDITNDVPASKQVQTDLAQTLTNKTLTSPVINSPTGIVKGDVGLGNVDNTSDANKPISTATQTALNLKADSEDLASYLDKTTYDPNAVGGDVFDQDNMVDGTTNKNFTATEKTKLAGIEALADVTDAANVAAAGAFMKSSDDADDITEGASHLFLTTSERSKLSGIEALADVTDAGNVASSIHGVSGKTTPVDADELGLLDSAASFALKVLTWANLKATLKTYFDTLYQPLASALTSWAGVTRASGFDTFAATPSSANLAALLTDETGTGSAYFTGGALGTPSSGTLTNCTGLPNASVIGLGTAALKNTGTSGNNVPLMDGANTWSGAQTFQTTADYGIVANYVGTSAAFGGPLVKFNHNSASPAASDEIAIFLMYANSSTGVNKEFAQWEAQIIDATNGSEDAKITFRGLIAGSTTQFIEIGPGVMVGNPTGGNKGVGTVNATAVYDDNSLLTCYVLEAERTGKIDVNAWDGRVENRQVPIGYDDVTQKVWSEAEKKNVDRMVRVPKFREEARVHVPAREFAASRMDDLDPAVFARKWRESGVLPGMPTPEEWAANGPLSTGQITQRLWELCELQAVHIAKLNDRVEALEKK